MYNRVYNPLNSKSFVYEKQFSFQRNNSTEHAILQLTRGIHSKAFDTADHQTLIKKLKYYGIDGTTLK